MKFLEFLFQTGVGRTIEGSHAIHLIIYRDNEPFSAMVGYGRLINLYDAANRISLAYRVENLLCRFIERKCNIARNVRLGFQVGKTNRVCRRVYVVAAATSQGDYPHQHGHPKYSWDWHLSPPPQV